MSYYPSHNKSPNCIRCTVINGYCFIAVNKRVASSVKRMRYSYIGIRLRKRNGRRTGTSSHCTDNHNYPHYSDRSFCFVEKLRSLFCKEEHLMSLLRTWPDFFWCLCHREIYLLGLLIICSFLCSYCHVFCCGERFGIVLWYDGFLFWILGRFKLCWMLLNYSESFIAF